MSDKKPSFKEIRELTKGAVASNPGKAKLNPIQWIRYNWIPFRRQVFWLVAGWFLMMKIHWLFGLVFIGALLYTLFHWWTATNLFKIGDVHPGKVISVKPDRIAVATNMSMGFGDYPIVKIVDTTLPKEDRVIGKIIPTIALYNPNPHGYPFWSEFHPSPIAHGTTNRVKVLHYTNTYDESDISALEKGIAQLPSMEPETYKINEETSGWKEYKHLTIGSLSKLKGPDYYKKLADKEAKDNGDLK